MHVENALYKDKMVEFQNDAEKKDEQVNKIKEELDYYKTLEMAAQGPQLEAK